MGCFVQDEKSVWDLLSTLSNQCGMFCPPWQSSVGSFVHLAKNGIGAFVHGIFCPASGMKCFGYSTYVLIVCKLVYQKIIIVSECEIGANSSNLR